MYRRILICSALLIAPSAGAQQPPDKDVLSTHLRQGYAAMSRNLAAVVELMPADDFGFRPVGAVEKVRTFGEIVAHLTLVNAFVCSMGDGKPDSTSAVSASIVDKPRLIALVRETNARCTAYLATLTDSALSQLIVKESAGRAFQTVRGVAVMFAIAHSNEHYGNLVTYLRAKGLVPPPAPAQAAFMSPAPKPAQ